MDIICSWDLAEINVLLVPLLTMMETVTLVFILVKHVQDLEKTCAIAVFQVMYISIINVKQIVMMVLSLLMEAAWFVVADVKHVQAHHLSVRPAMEVNISTKIAVMTLAQLQL